MKGLKKAKMRRAVVCVAVLALVLAVAAGYVTAAWHGAQRYDRSVESAAEATHELNQAIAGGRRVLDGYRAEQLKNPQLMTDLDQTLIQAKTLDAPSGAPNRWLLWQTNAAYADNERYAADAKTMATLVKRGADGVKASFKAKQDRQAKGGEATAGGAKGQSAQSAEKEAADQASPGENRCAAFAATYAMYQGGSAMTVHDDCGMTANGGGEPSTTVELAYVPQSFADNGDGTYSWQVDSMGKVTYYPAGVHAPAFDEFHASAGVPDSTLGKDRLVAETTGMMYVRND